MTKLTKYLKSRVSTFLKYPMINSIRGIPRPHFIGSNAQLILSSTLATSTATIVGRSGVTEGKAISFFLRNRLTARQPKSYPPEIVHELKFNSGFFSTANHIDTDIDAFCILYLRSIKSVDIYAAWMKHDALLSPRSSTIIRLYDLDPFFDHHAWTMTLRNRRVCVVSPFQKSILKQYGNREQLFQRPVLPEMDLSAVKAPSTHVNATIASDNWFTNLDELECSVVKTSPEVVIIGAGAYGMPLAYKLKSRGISSVVMGGSTQLLFGIKGRRWENDPQYRRIMNEHWIRPSEEERPPGHEQLEISGGAYW